MNYDFKYKNIIRIELAYYRDIPKEVVLSENSNDNEKKGWSFEKTIELSEPLATKTHLFFKLNNKKVISEMYNPQLIKVENKINFDIHITNIHFFDYETKKGI